MKELAEPEVIITQESDLDGFITGAEVPLEAYHSNYWKQWELEEISTWSQPE